MPDDRYVMRMSVCHETYSIEEFDLQFKRNTDRDGDEIRLHGEAGASVEQKNGRHQWKKDELPGKCVDKRRMQTNTSETRQRRIRVASPPNYMKHVIF